MQPINYGVEIQDPTQSFLSAFQTGAAIQDTRLKQEQQQQQMANQKLIQEGFSKLRQPGATAADYANLAMVLPEAQAKSVRESFNMLSGERQQNALQQSGQVFSAFKAGKPEIAISLLERQIEAKRNSGDNEGAMFLETWRDVAKENPKATEDYFGFTISQMPGGDKVIESAGKLGVERRAEAQAPAELRQKLAVADKAESDAKTALATATNAPEKAAAEAALAKAQADKAKIEAQFAGPLAQASLNLNAAQIKNINSEISNRAAKLNLDKQTMQATVAEKLSTIQKNLTELPADTRKLVNDSAVTAAAAKQSADQYNDLARRLDAAGGGYGAATSFADYLRKTTGAQSPLTELRQEYTRIRNSAAIKSLPPGVATDKDIELALKGIPPENANASTMASFLRGMGKMQDIEASVANAKTDWLANNNGVLTRSRNTFQAGDYVTKPGESFNDFTQRVVQDVSKRYSPVTQSPLVELIPTDRNPAPGAAQNNIRSQADAILRGGQ
jgi:GrpB-like predicted nucleotidyltransferase (UPF0157 family)